jgi:hypothetical protein
VAGQVGFDDAIVELISNEQVAGQVEPRVEVKTSRGDGVDGQQNNDGGG